ARAAAGPRGGARHARGGRLPRPAALRLAARQARRLGRDAGAVDRPDAAGTRRARARGRADDPRAGDRHPAQRGVLERPLLDRLPRRGGRPPAGDRRMTDPLVFRGPAGTGAVTPGALTELVARAARSVEGARIRRPKRSIEIRHGGGRASVELELGAGHGVPLPELARAVQERVADALGSVSGLEVERVDVVLEEVG